MPNPNLNKQQLEIARKLLEIIRREIKKVSMGDDELLFAYRRKISKELTYDERGKPAHRKKLKMRIWKQQKGKCAICPRPLKLKGAEADREYAPKGYASENVRLIHHSCHHKDQARKKFT